jgi:AraC-like DNA-binding protein
MATLQILLQTQLLAVGRFWCPPDDARWRTENWIGAEHHVVFPLRPVVIEQTGHRRLVANPNHVVLYDDRQTYRRELLSPDGDIATFLMIGADLAADLLRHAEEERARFPAPEAPLDPDVLLRIQLLARDLARGVVDPLTAEETVIDLLASVVDRARQAADETPPLPRARAAMRDATAAAHADLVDDARLVLSLHFADRYALADVARAVGASPYHLARIFRARTGSSLHAYREQIRLRHALERLTDVVPEANLARMAVDLWFSSHAHFDVRFRRTFGASPAAVRRGIRSSALQPRVGRAEMRTIVEVARTLPA